MFHPALRLGLGTDRFTNTITSIASRAALGLDTSAIARAALGLDIDAFARAGYGGVADDLLQSSDDQLAARAATQHVETWWTSLPFQARVAVVVLIVWVCVFVAAAGWSLENPGYSKYIQDHTQIGPLTLASGAALVAGSAYRRASRPD